MADPEGNEGMHPPAAVCNFYRTMLRRARYCYRMSSVRPSVTLVDYDHIGLH